MNDNRERVRWREKTGIEVVWGCGRIVLVGKPIQSAHASIDDESCLACSASPTTRQYCCISSSGESAALADTTFSLRHSWAG